MQSRSGGERGAERGEDDGEARRGVDMGEPADQAVQPVELAAGRGVDRLAGHERDDLVGVRGGGRDVGDHPAVASTTTRSASRNIWSMSCETSRIVVLVGEPPGQALDLRASRRRATRWARRGSRRRGRSRIARATATSWRWPPDSEATAGRVGDRDAERREQWRRRGCGTSAPDRAGCRRSRPRRRLEATSRLSQSARSCHTTATPRRATAPGVGLDPRAVEQDLAAAARGRRHAAHQRRLAGAVLPGQRDDLARPDVHPDVRERAPLPVVGAQRPYGQQWLNVARCLIGAVGGRHPPIVAPRPPQVATSGGRWRLPAGGLRR